MKLHYPAILSVFILGSEITTAQTVLERAQKDEIATVTKGDADMQIAFRKAKATLKEFLALVRVPRPTITSYAVKVAISDRDEREFFWISPFKEKDRGFVGRINNTPRLVHNVREGQLISFEEKDIVDWLYRENGKMTGNFTACALLRNESPKDAEAFQRTYGLTCDP